MAAYSMPKARMRFTTSSELNSGWGKSVLVMVSVAPLLGGIAVGTVDIGTEDSSELALHGHPHRRQSPASVLGPNLYSRNTRAGISSFLILSAGFDLEQ